MDPWLATWFLGSVAWSFSQHCHSSCLPSGVSTSGGCILCFHCISCRSQGPAYAAPLITQRVGKPKHFGIRSLSCEYPFNRRTFRDIESTLSASSRGSRGGSWSFFMPRLKLCRSSFCNAAWLSMKGDQISFSVLCLTLGATAQAHFGRISTLQTLTWNNI